MSRYINMVDVITYPVMPVEYRKYQTMNLDDAYEQGWYDLQNFIEKMPTADVRENVHGEWVIQEVCPPEYHGKHFCSKCGGQALSEGYKEYLSNFCPNCGADMRKGETNG